MERNEQMDNGVKQVDWSKWDSREDCFAKYRHVESVLIYGKLPNKQPDLSIMIPTYCRANLLKEAINSALNQKTQYTYTITVVDNDCEVDVETDRLMKEYCTKHGNILYYRNTENIGMFGNWNRCIELSKTEWLCLLHDDDMLMENYIETLFPITERENCGAICGFRKILDQRTNPKLHINESGKNKVTSLLMSLFMLVRRGREIPMTVQDAAHGLFMPSMANMLNKSVLFKVGGFDEKFFPSADVACYLKVTKHYKVLFIPQMLYWYRIAQNESLKEDTCWKMMNASASLVKAVSESIDLSKRRCNKNFYEELIITYNTFANTKKLIDFNDVAKHYALPYYYNNKWRQRFVVAKYDLRWGLTIFR